LKVLHSKGEPRRLLTEHRQMKLAQLQYQTALGMTPLSCAQLKLSTTRAALDLPSAMIDEVIEVGEPRKREAKDRDHDEAEA
jgi:hypothetical protein